MRSRRPPLRACCECGGGVYSWAEWVRCRRCANAREARLIDGLDPDGPAMQARRRRLAHDAEVEAMIARGEL